MYIDARLTRLKGVVMAIERNTWHDVSEKERTYFYGDGRKLTVLNVVKLKVSTHGRHYLQKRNGQSVVMQKGWLGVKITGELVV